MSFNIHDEGQSPDAINLCLFEAVFLCPIEAPVIRSNPLYHSISSIIKLRDLPYTINYVCSIRSEVQPRTYYLFDCLARVFKLDARLEQEMEIRDKICTIIVCEMIDMYSYSCNEPDLFQLFCAKMNESNFRKQSLPFFGYFESLIVKMVRITEGAACNEQAFYEILYTLFNPALHDLTNGLKDSDINSLMLDNIFCFLKALCVCDATSIAFLVLNHPKENTPGGIQSTALGALLSLSALPNINGCRLHPYLSKEDYLKNIEVKLNYLLVKFYEFIVFLMNKSDMVKNEVLDILQLYLKTHEGRICELGRMFPTEWINTDGFMLNLLIILVQIFSHFHNTPPQFPPSFESTCADPYYVRNQCLPTFESTLIDLYQFEIFHRATSSSREPLETIQERSSRNNNADSSTRDWPTAILYLTHMCAHLTLHENFRHKRYIEKTGLGLDDPPLCTNYELILQSKQMIRNITMFLSATLKWLYELASSAPNNLGYVPKFFLRNITDYFRDNDATIVSFLVRCLDYNTLILFAIKALESSNLIPDVYLRSELALMLFIVLKTPLDHSIGVMDIYLTNPIRKLIAPSVVALYNDLTSSHYSVESLCKCPFAGIRGSLRNFIRHMIQNPTYEEDLKCLITYPDPNEEIPSYLKFSHSYVEEFSQIADALMRINFLMKNGILQSNKVFEWKKVETLIILFKNCFATMKSLSHRLTLYLLNDSVLVRVATILNHCLIIFLKLVDYLPAIRDCIENLCRIYSNLSAEKYKPRFLRALMECSYFSIDRYKTLSELSKHLNVPFDFSEFTSALEEFCHLNACGDASVDNIPDEFLDNLTQVILEDPVSLPNTDIRLDRSTVLHHLLTSNTNPYTREPLTMKMLKPDDELREKIKKWKIAKH